MKILKQIIKCRQDQLAAQKKRKKPRIKLGNQNGYILFSLLLVGILIICVAMGAFSGMRSSMKTAGTQRIQGNAFNIAEAGKEHALSLLRLDSVALRPSQDSVILHNVAFDAGSYTVRCVTNPTMDTLVLRACGTAGSQTASIESNYFRYTIISKLHFTANAAVTSRSDVHLTGTILIDGNDYDSTNFFRLNPGVFGISTCGIYDPQNASKTYSLGRGYTGGSPPIDSVVKQNADPSGYPKTPEEVLGLSPGALDKIKTTSFPSAPFHGIVYVKGPGIINAPDFNGSTGIFIYHDTTFNSVLKDIHGAFKGILICDQIDHINGSANFLGIVVTLSSEVAGNAFGNGNASIRYSSQVINNLGNYIYKPLVFVDNISWKEI